MVEQGARNRAVYLPSGADWYDFHSGEKHRGGTTIQAAAPLSRMPLFVRSGSIVPTGPAIQHIGESLNAPLVLNVFTGADGTFEIYEDDGLSYDYEQAMWSRIPVSYDDTTGTVTIGARVGGFEGMATERRIAVRWINGSDIPADFVADPDVNVVYSGSSITVKPLKEVH